MGKRKFNVGDIVYDSKNGTTCVVTNFRPDRWTSNTLYNITHIYPMRKRTYETRRFAQDLSKTIPLKHKPHIVEYQLKAHIAKGKLNG